MRTGVSRSVACVVRRLGTPPEELGAADLPGTDEAVWLHFHRQQQREAQEQDLGFMLKRQQALGSAAGMLRAQHAHQDRSTQQQRQLQEMEEQTRQQCRRQERQQMLQEQRAKWHEQLRQQQLALQHQRQQQEAEQERQRREEQAGGARALVLVEDDVFDKEMQMLDAARRPAPPWT